MKRLATILRKITVALVLIYTIGIITGLGINLVLTEAMPIAGIIKSSIHLLLFPALVLLPLLLFFRRWALALLQLPAMLAFLIYYGPYLLPKGESTPTDADTLTVMTFNIQIPPPNEVASVVEIIRQADADIVGIQELSSTAATAFEAKLRNLYPYQALYTHPDEYPGQGILSRYPIVDEEYWQNEAVTDPLGHMRIELNMEDTEVILYNTHPVPPVTSDFRFNARDHAKGMEELFQRMSQDSGPMIVLGDFNMTSHFESYKRMTQNFKDAFREAGNGLGFTYPNGTRFPVPPIIRLDYIFYNDAFQAVNAQRWGTSGSSDHRPVLAALIMRDSAP